MVIKLNQTTPFFRAFDAYLKRVNRAPNSVVFVCAGARVPPNATPADLCTPDLAVFQVTDAANGHAGSAGAKTSATIQPSPASPKKTAAAASASPASASASASSMSESESDSDADGTAGAGSAPTTAPVVARHTRSRKPSPALLAALASSD